jgi:hypothetical protein
MPSAVKYKVVRRRNNHQEETIQQYNLKDSKPGKKTGSPKDEDKFFEPWDGFAKR